MPKTNKDKEPMVALAQFKIVLDFSVDIGAKTLEEALQLARSKKEQDFIDLEGFDLNDSSIEVTGVYQI